jgi:hypothetical protein
MISCQLSVISVTMNLNPYQGLKRNSIYPYSRLGNVTMNLNPYQGLKLVTQLFVKLPHRYQSLIRRYSDSNPYQGLKTSVLT